ncbi:MAG: cupin domain-containing protein [Acetobacteraceae bacterium]|nr:cupin domain-containing protein [Acetobacteraceae bacterium]
MPETALLQQPIMSDAGGGEALDALGMQVVVKVPAAASGGSVGVVEMLVPPGEGPPMHIHRLEEEVIHVLEGRFRFWCGDRVWDGYEGATVLLPRGIPHTFQAIGAPGRVLGTVAPGGFEGFFVQCAARGLRLPEDAKALRALAAEFGFDITGPKPAVASSGMGGR